MQYVEFRDRIQKELRRNHRGFTWTELRRRLGLPYERPCASWVERMEAEIGLSRTRRVGRVLIWRIVRSHSSRGHPPRLTSR
jgi:hypothetical protein